MNSDKKEAQKVSVKLLTDNHTHAGEPCAVGDVIKVRPDQSEKLFKTKQAEATKGENSEKTNE